MTLEKALTLLNLRQVPEGMTHSFFLNVTAGLVQRHGEAWLRQNRGWFLQELEYLLVE